MQRPVLKRKRYARNDWAKVAVDLFIWHTNFARKHFMLKTTPALALGLNVARMQTEDLWNIGVRNN